MTPNNGRSIFHMEARRNSECDWIREVRSGICGSGEHPSDIIKVYIETEFIDEERGRFPRDSAPQLIRTEFSWGYKLNTTWENKLLVMRLSFRGGASTIPTR
jgi:hypothetical protein